MDVLLDTCAILWAVLEPERWSADARLRSLYLVTGDRLILSYPHVQTVW
jgi:PIN domain nuclease of toxin-antitoxin system